MINEKNIEDWLIRSIENDLTENEQAELNDFLQEHPEFLADAEAYNKTILISDSSVIFTNKNLLKKPDNNIKPLWQRPLLYISVAASLLLLISIGFLLRISFQSHQPDYTTNANSTELNKSSSAQSTPPNNSIATNKSIDDKKNKIPAAALAINSPINHLSRHKKTGTDIAKTTREQKENIAEPVTYFTADTLHYIEANQITEIVYMDGITNKISPMEMPPAITNYNYQNGRRKSVKMIDGFLKRSGNTGLAKVFEKYDDLIERKYEISYSSALLSFHKTFNSNQ